MASHPPTVRHSDVTVIGGGMAGMAASLHLSRAGFRVVCIEPESGVRERVGESLDWASPALLANLGLPLEHLIEAGIATYKRGVTLQIGEHESLELRPAPWLGRAPFHAQMFTIHVDRVRLDRQIEDLVLAAGVEIVRDQAMAAEITGKRVDAVRTSSGERYVSPWFIDASGSFKSLLAREFYLQETAFGPRKVCFWDYFHAAPAHEGTTIYMQPGRGREYQDWIWEIPIGNDTLSVGYITTGEAIKKQRDSGMDVPEIFRRQLEYFPRLRSLQRKDAGSVPRVTSFHCRSYREVAGPNWILAGEAASMVDPITSNGVTSALRHGQEAAALIVSSRGKNALPAGDCRAYSRRVLSLGEFFNAGIDSLIYDWPVREHLGLRRAAEIYTAAAWSMNGVYSKWNPRTPWATAAYCSILDMLRTAARVYCRHCRTAA